MKTKCSFILKSSVSLLLAVLMLFGSLSTVLAATVDVADTGSGTNWNANIFFRVPDGWDLSTYPNVQAWAVQSASASSGQKYAFLLGNMSVAGTTSNSKLYHAWVSANHSSWGKTEYIAFTANTSNWNTGDFYISTCGQYTKPLNYGATNSSGSYLFSPSNASNNSATNDNTMSGSYNGTNRDVLKKAQDFYVYTNGSSSATGGSVKVDAYYVNGSNYSGSSAIATSSITVNSSDTGAHEQYEGAVEGTKVTLTATPATGFELQGYYDAATGGNAITSPYYVFGTKSVYARFVSKQYTITYKDQGGSTFSGTHASGYPTKHTYGTATTLKTATKSGYDFGGWYTTSACTGSAVTSLGATAYTSNITLYAKWTAQNTPLSAPTIKYNSATTTPVSMNAAKGSKARITWSAVTNAGSYEVFKDGTSKGTTTNLYYDIERGNSYGGTYTVKAIPSNTASYSTSDASNGIKFTFNKVALTAPTVTPDKTTILSNEKVTFTLSGGASSGTLGTDYKYQHSGANNTTYADVSGSSWQTGALDNVTTADVSDAFKFKTVAISTDYYTSSTGTTSKTITVKPAFGVDSGSTSTFPPGTATAMSYDSAKAAYYLSVTLTSTSNYYFRINQMGADPKWSGDWNTYPNVKDVVVDGEKVAADQDVSGWGNKASLHYSGSAKKIIIWFDYTNKKVWITGNSTKYKVTNTQPSATGASLKVAGATTSPQEFYEGDTVNYEVTAGSGNVITGVTINGTTTAVDRKTSYTGSFDITGNTTISATVVPQYSITNNTATGGSYTVKRGSTTVTTFIAGDVLTITPTPDAHYDFTKFAITGGKTYTITTSPYTLDTTGATGNITITPTWTPTTYTSLTAVGKYSTDGSTYGTAMPTAPTIKATSGTYQTGVQVTAPDVSGYKFVEWYTDKGTFGNSADKQTMFKPNANGAQAVARYKKLFTITSSVESGTGAGTVSTSVAEVEAGGSYTITAAAATGSAVESVKVNGTAKTATASQTISSVSADQTVVVKFKSNIAIRGGSTIGTNWDSGDAMTSNAAGTEFTKAYNSVAAGTYEFKLYNGTSYSDDSSATVTITGGSSTGTMTNAAAGVNWKLTLKKAANVTIKSDGTKITEIKVVPADATKYKVTFKKAANTTITGTYEGTNFTTASADAEVQVYSGDEISFTVTAASGYHISNLTSGTTPAFSPAVTKEYKLSNVTAAKTITPTAAADVNVAAKTNKSSRGTVSIDKTKSYKGDTVKITVTPLTGSLKTLTATYANGVTYEYKSNTWKKVTAGTTANNAFTNIFLNPAKAAFGMAATGAAPDSAVTGASIDEAAMAAMPDIVPVGATQTINMVMQEDSAVTINATFDTYSAESNYYYNGYDTSGNALSGYTKKQMTEVMLEGVPYSYYQVTGRSGADQLMTVSKQTSTGNTGYAYFTRPSNWGAGWSNTKAPYAYFFNDSGQVGANYPGTMMTFVTGTDHDFKIAIPDGATKVIFSDSESGGSGAQTVDITMTSTTSAYYLNGGYQDVDGTRKYEVTAWPDQPSDAGIQTNTTEYWYNASNRYYGYVNGFNESNNSWSNHNAGSHTTDGNRFAEPGENTGNKTYYVMVFYAGKKYTSGSGTLDLTGNENHDVVMWSYELPSGSDDENVTVYAKDGAIRAETFGSTYANIADTKIYLNNTVVGTDHSGNITNQTYQTYKAAKGDTLVIKTQIGATDSGNLSNADALKAKYYVRGFCVNGEVSELLEWKSDGLYTLTYKIPEDTEITKFEITPIYYLKDTTAYPIVTYRVTGFTDELKAVGTGKPGWGDTLYTYPYYGKLGGDSNAFGAYPGQPMVYYKGQYQMQIPQKSTTWVNTTSSNTTVSGVTMSNGYWDSVHKSIMGYGDNSTSADHVQTYDYGDFYKIFNEKKPVDNIVFDFKYRTKKHNFESNLASSYTKTQLDTNYGTNGNGFELLTNFHGRTVDLFGTPLSGEQLNATPVYVLSIGGVNETAQTGVENIAGYYATEWMVYGSSNGSSYTRITGDGKNSIPPEVLVLNDDDDKSFNTTTYPSADASHNVTDWQTLYHNLEAYRGKPVMISYEAADAQQGQSMFYAGTGGATRNDGRWLYSKTGENITSTIKIQYSNDNGVTYTDLNTTAPEVTGLSAYFTNDGVEGQMTYSTTIDPDKTFDFEAKTTNGNYKFVGWYMKDGTKITSDNASHTERSGSYTFVAKFMKVESGQLILSHSVDTNATYKGAGTAKISAVVKDGDEVIRTYDLTTSDITMDDKIIKSDSTYTIDVTLEATATGNDTYGITTLANPSDQASTYFSEKSSSIDGKTKTIVLNSFTVASLFSGTTQNVKNIIYHSYFHQTKFDYQLTFIYKDRFNESKSFTRKGQLTSSQVANTNYVQQSDGSFTLRPAFIQTVAPYESNFGEDITWNINDVSFTKDGSDYTCTADINSIQTKDTKRNVTFVLPYEHSNGIATGGNTGTAAETTNFDLIGNNAVTFDTIPTLLNNGVNGIYDEDIKKNWIAAPATINDNSTTKYFQYWSVKSTSADGANDPEVARCYFQGFNFCALDNYTVTAVYGNEATDISNSGIYTGVSYLETSRNQWNDNQDRTKSEGTYASDLLFNDFILNYNFKGVDIYRGGSDTNDIQELGVVVERVQELGINQDGSKDTDISHYTSIDESRSTVEDVIKGNSSDKKFTKDAIAKTALDNKNRIKFYEAFYNGKGWNMVKQSSDTKYAYKNYVYRAYTYIKYKNDQGQTVIQLSAKPAYFTMYDEAVAEYVAPTTNTSGN